jgi:hypothetical protein
MYYQRFSVSRAVALSLSVAFLTAAPLLCVHPISTQVKRAQRAAMQHSPQGGTALSARVSTSRFAESLRPAVAERALTHQSGNGEPRVDGECGAKACGIVNAGTLRGTQPERKETKPPGVAMRPLSFESVQSPQNADSSAIKKSTCRVLKVGAPGIRSREGCL